LTFGDLERFKSLTSTVGYLATAGLLVCNWQQHFSYIIQL